MTTKVEFGFTKNASGEYVYRDISTYVKSVSVSRGKQNNLGPFNAGQANVDLLNRSRAFDPTYTGSPFYGEVQPTGGLRISRDGIYIFTGLINDWNLSYTLDGDSVASISASDAFSVFTNQTYGTDVNYSAELSSVRLGNVLNASGWSSSKRRISLGQAVLDADSLVAGDNILDYMQKVEASEAGRLYMDKAGNVVFKTRNDNSYGSAYSYTRKNLCKNPSFEVDTTYWSAGTRSTSAFLYGAASLNVTSATSIDYPQNTATPYTLSCYVKAASGTPSVTISAQESSDGTSFTTTGSTVTTVNSTDWTRISVSYVSDYSKTYARLGLATTGSVYVDGVLIEASSNLGDYFDGTVKPSDDAVYTYTSVWDGV